MATENREKTDEIHLGSAVDEWESLRQSYGGSQADFVRHLLSLHRATPQKMHMLKDTVTVSMSSQSVDASDPTSLAIVPKEEPGQVGNEEPATATPGCGNSPQESGVIGQLVPFMAPSDKVDITRASGEKPYICTHCGRGHSRAAALKKHMRSHTEEDVFSNETTEEDNIVHNSKRGKTMQGHVRTQSEEKANKIQPGRKSKTSTSNVKEKQKRVNVKEQEKRSNAKGQHKRANGKPLDNDQSIVKPFKCTFCDKCFKLKNTLTTHLRTHTGEEPCVCNHCGKGFSQPATLARHLCKESCQKVRTRRSNVNKIGNARQKNVKTRQSLTPTTTADSSDNESAVGEIDCDNSSDYMPNSAPRQTKRSRTPVVKNETGKLHFICPVCDTTFKTSIHLTTHLRTHIGERPCICPYCEKGFGQPSTLGRHLKTGLCQKGRNCRPNKKKLASVRSLFSTPSKIISKSLPSTPSDVNSSPDEMVDDDGDNSSDYNPNDTSPKAKKLRQSTDVKKQPVRATDPDRPFPCTLCGMSFKSKNHLTTHTRTHTGEKPCVCIHCGKGFGQPATLGRHLRTESCQKVRTRRPNIKKVAALKMSPSTSIQTKAANIADGNVGSDHHQAVDTYQVQYTCTHCSEQFKDASILNKHMQVHADQALPTQLPCKQEVKASTYSGSHQPDEAISTFKDDPHANLPAGGDQFEVFEIKQEADSDNVELMAGTSALMTNVGGNAAEGISDDGNEMAVIDYDNSSDYNPDNDMDSNMDEQVERSSPQNASNGDFICEHCGKSFQRKTNLNLHMRSHLDAKEHQCTVCAKAFLQKSTLTRHMQVHLVGARQGLMCRRCNIAFSSLDDLKEHRMFHRKEKKFLCTYCGKAFSNRSHLTAHLRVHTGEKPFKCEHCGKGFTQKTMLTIHIRTHTGERPYVCTVCGHGSITKSTLDKHIRKHTGEKPYSCPICHRAFSDQSYIRVHVRTTHRARDGDVPPGASPAKKRTRRRRGTGCVKPYLCCECGKRFGSMASLDKHAVLHTDEQPQTCPHCHEEFYTASLLEVHVQQVHPEEWARNAVLAAGEWAVAADDMPGVVGESADGTGWLMPTGQLPSKVPGKPHACAQCGRAFKQVAHLKAHIRIHTGERPYLCRVCGQGFTQTSILNRHLRDIHPSISIYTCVLCETGFDSHKELREHRKTHAENTTPRTKQVECSECDRKFLHPSDMKRHMLVHTGDKPFICNHCGKGFASASSLKGHIMTHTGERPHVCPTCGKGCITLGNLHVHMRIHTGEKPYKCLQCDKRFRMKSLLTYHESTHADVKAYLCSTCGKAFGNMINLKKHMRNVHAVEKTTVCPHCGKCFKRPANLQKHIVNAHTGPSAVNGESPSGEAGEQDTEKLYPCTGCDKRFKWASYLKTHMRTHTGEKPYACTYCNKGFITSCHLKKHIMCHTGERPYTCPHCERRFRQQSVLKTHIRTHTGEKPFVCPECGKRFCQSAELSRHKMVHTGEKPHICPHCGRGCQTAATLTKHIRTHTGEKPYACRHCERTFADPSGLGTHMRDHTGDKPHMCSHCGKRFTTLSKVTQHLLCHTNEKPHVCPHCGNGYKAKFTLMKHIRTHTHPHEKPAPRRRTPRDQRAPRPVHVPIYTHIPAPKHTHTLSLGPTLTHTHTINSETVTALAQAQAQTLESAEMTQEVIHAPDLGDLPTPLLEHTVTQVEAAEAGVEVGVGVGVGVGVAPEEQTLIPVGEHTLQTYTEDEVAISVQNIENTVTVSTTENNIGEPIYHFVILDQSQYQ